MNSKLFIVLFVMLGLNACKSTDVATPTTEEFVWEVADTTVDCDQNGKCLQVKSVGDDTWTVFYDTIEGFDYQPGYSYTIRVKKEAVLPMKDRFPAARYSLVTINTMQKTAVTEGDIPILGGSFSVTSLNGKDVAREGITLNIDPETKRISGYAGCNNYNLKMRQTRYQLRFSQPTTTKMLCKDKASLEKEFLITFIQGDRFTLEGDTLRIYDIDNQILEAQLQEE
ncbi:MAG: DUF4377 domain-containing protein [Dokdonia sp.]|jgi:heat shock protein HslJ